MILARALAISFAASLCSGQVLRHEAELSVQLVAGQDTVTEGELSERLLSDALVKSEAHRVQTLGLQMALHLAELKRELKLDDARMKRLHIAAKGAVNDSLSGWRSAQENQVRQLTQGAKPEQIPARLGGMGEMQIGTEVPQARALWIQSIGKVLTPEEKQSLAALDAQREAYRNSAVTTLLLSEMEKKLSLTDSQVQALEPQLQAAFASYLPDMGAYMDRGGGMDLRMLTLVLNAVPQEAQSSILKADQLERWRALTQEFSGWWQNIKQNHDRRVSGSGVPAR
jgi:hypothetical protein